MQARESEKYELYNVVDEDWSVCSFTFLNFTSPLFFQEHIP